MLLRFANAVWLICLAAIIGARLLGTLQPAPTLAAMLFENVDGSPCAQPCLLGIRAEVADFDAALNLLRRHPADSGPDFGEWALSASVVVRAGKRMTILLNDSNAGLITMLQFTPPLPLRDIIRELGAPEQVYYDRRSGESTFWLMYHSRQLAVEVRITRPPRDDDRLEVDAPVVSLRLTALGFLVSGAQGRWHGFANARWYR